MKIKLYSNGKIIQDSPLIQLPDFVVLTGKNGSGKTQLLRAIGFQESKREILFDDDTNIASIIFSEPGLYMSESSQAQFLMTKILEDWRSLHPIIVALGTVINDHNFEVNNDFVDETNKKINTLIHSLSSLMNSNGSIIFGMDRRIEAYEFHKVSHLCRSSKKRPSDITFSDFIIFSYIHAGLFSNYIDLIFHQYSLKQTNYPHLVENIEAPWLIFNKILENANFKYNIEYIKSQHEYELPQATLIDRDNSNRVNVNQLSSGEKTILSLVITLYNSQNGVNFPQLLVLDEPDAFLHPSMAKQFLNVINEVLVKEKGVKVILSTHSPSTVALAPEESIFLMNRELGYLIKGDKNEAIRTLTAGLATFNVTYEHRKQVFTEDKIDEFFYQNLYQKLVYEDLIDKDLLLQFISIGFGKSDDEEGASGNGGCTLVKKFTKQLNENGNPSVFGLIDWDKKNKEEGKILVLGGGKRYCLENYIYDPLFILCSASIISCERLEELGLEKFDETHHIKEFHQEKLQNLVDKIFLKIKPHVDFKDIDSRSDDLLTIELFNGLLLQYPSWFLLSGGHRIKDACFKEYPFLYRLGKDHEYVSRVIIKNYWFLAKEVIDTIERLQKRNIE